MLRCTGKVWKDSVHDPSQHCTKQNKNVSVFKTQSKTI